MFICLFAYLNSFKPLFRIQAPINTLNNIKTSYGPLTKICKPLS